MPSDENKIEIIYDHYKDTSTKVENYCKLRGRYFLYILFTLSLIYLGLFSYSEAENIVSQFIANKLGIISSLDIYFVGSIIWFGLLVLVMKYFQIVATIEKYYPYLHKLEKQISHYYGEDIINREGRTYLENYPWFSIWTHFLYTIIFPILLLTAVTLKILSELEYQWPVHSSTIFNSFVFTCLVISTLLYLKLIHLKK